MKNKKTFKAKFTIAASILMLLITVRCAKDDKVEPLTSGTTSGNDKVSTFGNDWTFDKPHCNVRWETMYYGDNALLTGRFNNYNVDIDFDEASPETGKINAWVQLSTFNTGEPGRDGPGKCAYNYMGIEYLDTLYTVDPNTDTAWFKSTSIEKYGDGYLAKGDLTFRGVTKTQNLYFRYVGQHDDSPNQDGSVIKCGFTGQFTMKARTDYGVPSTSINDEVTVKINVNLKKN